VKITVRYRSGFSLVEVTLALGVAAVCLVTIFALLPVGLQTTQNANQQVASADIMGAVIADLRATPLTIPPGSAATSPKFAIPIPANPVGATTTTILFFSSKGQFSSSVNSDSRYQLAVAIVPNSAPRAATLVNLKMTWPAAASPANASGSGEMFLALDRN
jgi:Tfp pilus assembly protein PilV